MSENDATAVLFDIDGTLVDSNYLHIEAWSHAFHDLDVRVDSSEIHQLLGMDSAKLLDATLGHRVDELGDRAKELHSGYYLDMSDRLRPFAGASELISDLAGRGVRVVLATSAPDDELEILRRVLDVDQYLTDETSADDVETAKPEPDVVRTALQKAGTSAAASIFVGDTRWDAIAAERAGVQFVGVLSGGLAAADLRGAGATAIFRDVGQLRDTLSDGPLARLWG